MAMPGLGAQSGVQQPVASSVASTMAVLGQAGDLFRQWQIQARAHSRATRKEMGCVCLCSYCSQCGEERAFALLGCVCLLDSIPELAVAPQ